MADITPVEDTPEIKEEKEKRKMPLPSYSDVRKIIDREKNKPDKPTLH